MGVHWKIQFLGWGGLTKNQYIGGHGLKRGWGSFGHFVDLGGAWQKREMWCFWGVLIPQCTLWLKFEKQIQMSTILFITSDLNKLVQAPNVKIHGRQNHITHLFHQYIKNLYEWEIGFLSSYFSEKWSNVYKTRKSSLLE